MQEIVRNSQKSVYSRNQTKIQALLSQDRLIATILWRRYSLLRSHITQRTCHSCRGDKTTPASNPRSLTLSRLVGRHPVDQRSYLPSSSKSSCIMQANSQHCNLLVLHLSQRQSLPSQSWMQTLHSEAYLQSGQLFIRVRLRPQSHWEVRTTASSLSWLANSWPSTLSSDKTANRNRLQ